MPACDTDLDCPTPFVCAVEFGVCGPDDDSGADLGSPDDSDGGGGDPSCTSDAECPGEAVCDLTDGSCGPAGGGPTEPVCETDADCEGDAVCDLTDGSCGPAGGDPVDTGIGDTGGGFSVGSSCDDTPSDTSGVVGALSGEDWGGESVFFTSGAWWMSADLENVILVVSEDANTCDVLSSLSGGSYADAAFQVSLSGWTDYEPGLITMGGADPSLRAGAYVVIDGSGVDFGMAGADSTFTVGYLEPGEVLEFSLNIDASDSDPSRGVEGSGTACYCPGLDGFSFPVFGE